MDHIGNFTEADLSEEDTRVPKYAHKDSSLAAHQLCCTVKPTGEKSLWCRKSENKHLARERSTYIVYSVDFSRIDLVVVFCRI